MLGLILIPHKEFGVVPIEGGQAERNKREVFVGCLATNYSITVIRVMIDK